ncbi:MAG: sugar transferase [Gemmatimonadota bacterium]|nr:sugar transferase [Gemmatimonadota bacterium]
MSEPGVETMEASRGLRPPQARRAERRHLRLFDPSVGANGDGAGAVAARPEVSAGLGPVERAILRGLNVVVAAGALLLLAPVFLVIAVAIRLDSRGPVIYRQLRVGLDRRSGAGADSTGRRRTDLGGRPFTIYKFRTMRVDAEDATGPVWARPRDGRVTRVGAVLRKTRLDELPQFWNVIRGEMSVVGPRPERPNFVLELRKEIDAYAMRHRVPPGITGWAQVNRGYDRNVEDVREKLGYDLEYLEKRSIWFDLLIMLRTIPVMLERDKSC